MTYQQKDIRLYWWLKNGFFLTVSGLFFFTFAQAVRGADEYSSEFYHDFRGQPKPAELTWFNVKDKKTNLVREQPEGLRITIPKNIIHDWGGVGIRTAFGFQGDFEVTTTFEILQADTPPHGGFGAGVCLAVAKAGGGMATLARVVLPANTELEGIELASTVGLAASPFVGNALTPIFASFLSKRRNLQLVRWEWANTGNNADLVGAAKFATAKSGRLRLKRAGTTVFFMYSPDTLGDDFREMHRCEFGNGDIERVRLTAVNGRTSSIVDVRLLDLRIRGNLPTVKVVQMPKGETIASTRRTDGNGSTPGSDTAKSLVPGTSPPAADYPAEFYHDFRVKPPPPELTKFNVDNDNLMTVEPEGLRIKIPSTFTHKWAGVGFKTAFGFKSDFEITATIEILQADRPPSGFGAGVELFLIKAGGGGGSISRLVRPNGNATVWWVLDKNPAKEQGGVPCIDTTGRMRLRRVGATLYYAWAPGIQGDNFQEIHQCEFGKTDLNGLRLSALNGRTSTTVNVRLARFAYSWRF